MHTVVLRLDIMDIVGCNNSDSYTLRKFQKQRIYPFLFGQAMVLKL